MYYYASRVIEFFFIPSITFTTLGTFYVDNSGMEIK